MIWASAVIDCRYGCAAGKPPLQTPAINVGRGRLRIDVNRVRRGASQMPATQTNVAPAFRKTTETFTAGAKSLAQRYFISPEIFAQEQEKIFSTQWVLVGHQSQIAKGGDYFAADVAGESLIVVRDRRSMIRGFYNVCRHRGTRLQEDESGHVSAIQCPYHAWTYGLDGRLLGAPHMDGVPGFDKADYSLHPVNLALWEGFIFVNLSDSPPPLDEWFAPLAGKFSHWNLPNLAIGETDRLRRARELEVDVRKLFGVLSLPGRASAAVRKFHPMIQRRTICVKDRFSADSWRSIRGKSLTMSGNACAAFVGKIENLQRFFIIRFSRTCCSVCIPNT